jgi:glycosyltransferase involved in cell wall biosynthesis
MPATGSTDPPSPSVSVAIPLYNPSPRFLTGTVDSLRAQTLPPTEVVFTDDSERDHGRLIERLAEGLPYRHIRNAQRLGMVENWNTSVRAGSSEYVVVLHQDDSLEPDALRAMSQVFVDHDDVAICAVGETRVDEYGEVLCRPTRPNHRERLFLTRGVHEVGYADLTYLMLRNGQIFGEPSAFMMSRAHFDAVGGFDAAFRQSVDIDFALRMARSGRALYLTDRLVRRRVHRDQATQANVIQGRNLVDRRTLYHRHFLTQPYSDNDIERVKANLVVRAVFDGLRAFRFGRWSVVKEAASQVGEYRPRPAKLGERLVELALWVNDDAR